MSRSDFFLRIGLFCSTMTEARSKTNSEHINEYMFVDVNSDIIQINMNRSGVHLLDLPNEILLIILKKLNNVDVLYSLWNINNQRLNILVQEKNFSDILNFVSIDNICSVDRFRHDILPGIHNNVKYLILKPVLMKRILLATDYPNLTKLKILNFQQEIVSQYFTSE